ncbi:GDSL-type esterase/lipase family protein [Streptomyces sp. NPDC048508]|uniref:GDSL-type esterase/lipase family protein n=1 Tax=Streptomyces sp. NPDC048508 TaxID=3365561 RepID=UPI003710943A
MGDSYIAGNAGRWLGNSDTPFGNRSGTDRAVDANGNYDLTKVYGQTAGKCFRSDTAEIKMAGVSADHSINLACSGAESKNIWRASHGGETLENEQPQADQLAKVAAAKNVQLIVLSIGGNDIGFGDILAKCMTSFMNPFGSQCNKDQEKIVDARMANSMLGVDKAVKEIRGVMNSAGYNASQYRLVLQSYPSPLPRSSEMRYAESGGDRIYHGCPMYNADLDWARNVLMPKITAELKTVAKINKTEFLDLSDALAGREVCAKSTQLADSTHPPLATKSEWARYFNTGLLQGALEDSLHPNAFGQRALGTCLKNLQKASPGLWKCKNTPGAATDTMPLYSIN